MQHGDLGEHFERSDGGRRAVVVPGEGETRDDEVAASSTTEPEGARAEPPPSKCKSLLYAWKVDDAYYFVVHVMDHANPMPSSALRGVSQLINSILTTATSSTSAVEQQADLSASAALTDTVVLHYLPEHKLMDLTLMDSNGDGTATSHRTTTPEFQTLRAVAEKDGIVPFLKRFLRLYNAHVVGDAALPDGGGGGGGGGPPGLKRTAASLCCDAHVELRYDEVEDLTSSRFTFIEHDVSGGVRAWPLLSLLVDRCVAAGLGGPE